MEIPRHWRLKKQRLTFSGIVTNLVTLYGTDGAIQMTKTKQEHELGPIKKLIRREESVNGLKPPKKISFTVFSSSK